MKTLNVPLLNQMIGEGYVTVQKHPDADLFIYNYSQTAQLEKAWNEVTLQCRGLILDQEGKIIARPFEKFFNLGEQEDQSLPDEAFEVYEKMDGSLGILYWLNDKPFIATRGSFSSDQAVKANKILRDKYNHLAGTLSKDKTYLFEIIYPENRVVVDYGGLEDLVLLAIIDTATGKEEGLKDIGFPLVPRYHGIQDIHTLRDLEENNKEGFVIKFKNGLRYKVKFQEYIRLHYIMTQVSNITLWECLKDNKPMEEILEKVPDEFYNWVKKTVAGLSDSYLKIEDAAKAEYKVLETRKETALYFQQCCHSSILFSMLDNKDYAPIIWRQLRPKFSRPFSNFEE